jgi:hypothetical protein
MQPGREIHNRAGSRGRSRAWGRRARTDTDSVAIQPARPGGVAKKTPRRKRKEAARKSLRRKRKELARKKLGTKWETLARTNPPPQSRNAAASIYIYKALPKDEIRLLLLQPGLRDQPLECMLKDSKLCDSIDSEYEALSYVWGSEVPSKTITLCSRKFDVRQNLFDALLELRHRDSERVLWIDALCINQCDKTEKSHQVLAMNKIYERAGEVIAWLGPVTEDEELWLKLMCTADISVMGVYILQKPSVRKAIDLLMSRPYWYRAWVVQEIAFARLVRIQCGKYSMSFEALEQAQEVPSSGIRIVLTPEEPSSYVVSPTPFPRRLFGPRSASSGSSDGILPGVFLDSLLDRECSDPRDSVFAFYNLFPETLRKCITIDYELEPETVLLQTVSAIIKTTQSLSAVTTRSRQKVPTDNAHIWQQDMPSWCPYVSTSFENDSLAAWQSPPYLDAINPEISVDLSKKHVHTYGFTIGTISEMIRYGEPLVDGDKGNFSESEIDNILHCFSVWGEYGLSIPKYDGTSEAPLSMLHISSARGLKSLSTDMSLQYEAIRCYRMMKKRRVCKIETVNSGASSVVGAVPAAACGNDKICWIIGCPSALVLRMSKLEGNQDQLYKVVGEAYIEDIYKLVDTTKRERFILQ